MRTLQRNDYGGCRLSHEKKNAFLVSHGEIVGLSKDQWTVSGRSNCQSNNAVHG